MTQDIVLLLLNRRVREEWRTMGHLSYVLIIIVTSVAANSWLLDAMSKTSMLIWYELIFIGEDQIATPLI